MNRWIESDWALRITSVIIAVVLWLIVTHSFPFQQEDQTTLRIDGVPVEMRYDKDEFAIQELNHKKVQLTLTGNKKDLQSIPSYQVYADLRNIPSGKRVQVPIQVSGLPKDIQVKVFPAHLTVFLDKKVQKAVPVRVRLEGKLPPGYEIEQTVVTPANVLLKGTETYVKKISEAEAVVNIENAKFPLDKWVRLTGNNKRTHFSPESVKVSITVRKTSKNFPLVANVQKKPPAGYHLKRIELDPNRVTVYGRRDLLDSIVNYPPIPLDLSKVTHHQTLTVDVPSAHEELDVQPKKVKVNVLVQKEE